MTQKDRDDLEIICMVKDEFDRAGIIAATRAAKELIGCGLRDAFEWAKQINGFETELRLN